MTHIGQTVSATIRKELVLNKSLVLKQLLYPNSQHLKHSNRGQSLSGFYMEASFVVAAIYVFAS